MASSEVSWFHENPTNGPPFKCTGMMKADASRRSGMRGWQRPDALAAPAAAAAVLCGR